MISLVPKTNEPGKSARTKPPVLGDEDLSKLRDAAQRVASTGEESPAEEKGGTLLWAIPCGLLLCLGLGYGFGSAWPWKGRVETTASTPQTLVAQADSAVPLKPGPWGNLEALPIFIEPPDEYLPVSSMDEVDSRWRFSGFNEERLLALFRSANLTADQLAALTDTSKWQFDSGAILLDPPKDVVLSLTPPSRKQIYMPMVNDPASFFYLVSRSWPAGSFDEYFANSGLSSETISLIRRLSFPYGNLIMFCDLKPVLDTLTEPDQKTRLVKTLMRKKTLLLRLHITPDSNIDALEHYWIKAGWGLDLRPMMESLSRLPQGARIDVVELFPPVPSAHIYTYPFPSLKPEDLHKDCRWTAMNFFRDIPDDRFTDSKVVLQTLDTDYYPVLSDARYGDIVALVKPNGETIHVAVFIADDIVYTKNSGNFRDPFILMNLRDMIEHFDTQIPEGQSLQVRFFRNKYY